MNNKIISSSDIVEETLNNIANDVKNILNEEKVIEETTEIFAKDVKKILNNEELKVTESEYNPEELER